MPLHIAILYGSVREARVGIRVVRFLSAALRRRGHTVAVVDPAEKQLPLLDRMYKEYERGSAPPVMEELAQLYREVDGFAIVSVAVVGEIDADVDQRGVRGGWRHRWCAMVWHACAYLTEWGRNAAASGK